MMCIFHDRRRLIVWTMNNDTPKITTNLCFILNQDGIYVFLMVACVFLIVIIFVKSGFNLLHIYREKFTKQFQI